MQKVKLKVVRLEIPDRPVFPEEYRNGSVEVAVWPSVGMMPSVLDREGGLERLEEWAIENILLGFIEGEYSEEDLLNDVIFIKVSNKEGEVLLDTFVWGDRFEPDSPYVP